MQLCVCGDASKGSKEDAKNKNSSLLGGKTPALQAAQLAVQSKVQREKNKRSYFWYRLWSIYFWSLFDRVKLFRKAGQKTAEACPNRNRFFFLHLPLFSFSSVLHLFSKRTLTKNSRKSQSLMNDLKKAWESHLRLGPQKIVRISPEVQKAN